MIPVVEIFSNNLWNIMTFIEIRHVGECIYSVCVLRVGSFLIVVKIARDRAVCSPLLAASCATIQSLVAG